MSNRINTGTFTNDQRIMLNFYLTAYNDIRNDIDYLYETLDNVVNRINVLSRNVESQNVSGSNRTHANTNNLRNNFYRNRNPLNPDNIINDYLYNDFGLPRLNRTEIPRVQPRQNIRQTTAQNTTLARTNAQLLEFLGQFYNNVPVVPTRQQIDSATRRVLYREIEEPLNSSCPICLDRFQPDDNVTQIIHCGHIFNEDSINLWFRANVRCPVCRYDIREQGASVNTNAPAPAQGQAQSQDPTPSPSLRRNPNHDNDESESDDEDDNQTPGSPINSAADASFNSINGSSTPANSREQNLSVERDPVTNSIERISYDLTDDNLISNLTNIAGDLLFGNNNPQIQYNNGNQRFVYDASSNIVMFETYFQRQP
jgi:E3 ubiquitin-protein ligase ATL6/9/15/31/42/55